MGVTIKSGEVWVNFPLTLILSLWWREDHFCHWDFGLDLAFELYNLSLRAPEWCVAITNLHKRLLRPDKLGLAKTGGKRRLLRRLWLLAKTGREGVSQ